MGAHRIRKTVGVMKLPGPDLALLDFSQIVVTKCEGNVYFASPGAIFTNLAASNTVFATSISNMKTVHEGGIAKAAARLSVEVNLGHALDFVNGAVSTLPPAQAAAAINSSGFPLRQITVRQKPPLEAKWGGVTGAVGLFALSAGRGAVYVFEFSTDMKTWTSVPQVFRSRTVISGLTVGTTYYFRFQAQTHKGVQSWSDAVSFVVH